MSRFRLLAAALLAGLPLGATALSPLADLGQKIFNDPMLSASGRQSCATCHAPGKAFLAPNTLPVQIGGAAMNLSGFRNVPSAAYAQFNPRQSPAGVPLRGGLQLDGRAMDLVAQAQMPFTSTVEMGNVTTTEVRQRLILRPYLPAFQAIFGATLLRDPDATVHAMGQAIAAYETKAQEFQSFTSKYDAALIGRATLTAQEQNGQALFNSNTKGNCVMCHNGTGTTTAQMFTNYGYRAIAVPRNWKIPYNQDVGSQPGHVPANGTNLGAPNHRYYDLGACGPFRTDLADQTGDCGRFKVPGLRNVALKGAYEHNGVFNSLAQVLDFYNTRDLQPERWYRKADGLTPDIPYNDLPVIYQGNVERHPPFQPLPGNRPHLTASEIQDIVVFLCALTDGYDPANPSAYPYPAQCKAALRP